MTEEDADRNQAILMQAGAAVFATINQVLQEELRHDPAAYRRILARLKGLSDSPPSTSTTRRPGT